MTTEMHSYIAELEIKIVGLMKIVADFCLEANLNDSDFIEMLIDIGFTEKDFQMFGYGDFVKEYFEED